MKNIKKLYALTVLGTLAVTLSLFSSCKKEDIRAHNLSPEVEKQLAASRTNWNTYMGNRIKFEGYSIVGAIENDEHKKEILDKISDENAIVAFGNLKEPASVQVSSLSQLAKSDGNNSDVRTIQENMIQFANDALKANDQIIEIQWIESGGNRFSTLCFARDTGIIWDNILTGVVMMDEPIEAFEADPNSRASNSWYKKWWWLEWIWGAKRGEVGYKITIYYYCSGKVCSTDAEDWGWMNLGSAKSESKVLVNSGQTYGKIKYALGLATPAGSLSFNSSTFTVSFSGLGSNVVANGTKSWFLP